MKQKKESVQSGDALNKYISNAGVCSRRQAVEYIKTGKVSVNGVVVTEPGYRVQPGDAVECNYEPVINKAKKVYILVNKPSDHISTVSDERGRRTVIDLVGEQLNERLYPIGRLDRGTTGLLILTNDGQLTQKLSHPRYEVQKLYVAVLDKLLNLDDLKSIAAGIELSDGRIQVDDIKYVPEKHKNHVEVLIHSGKNRIVKRIFEHFGYKVIKLDRVCYAGLTKRGLPVGKWRVLAPQEVVQLKAHGSVCPSTCPPKLSRSEVHKPLKRRSRVGFTSPSKK
jgi:23S rRNA pseudouridine2605 synthase